MKSGLKAARDPVRRLATPVFIFGCEDAFMVYNSKQGWEPGRSTLPGRPLCLYFT